MSRVSISRAVEEGAQFVGCDAISQFFGSVGIKISGIEMGFVAGGVSSVW